MIPVFYFYFFQFCVSKVWLFFQKKLAFFWGQSYTKKPIFPNFFSNLFCHQVAKIQPKKITE
jgi:hypothetical protein